MDLRLDLVLEVLRVRHRHVVAGDALDRRVEGIEAVALQLVRDLRAEAGDHLIPLGVADVKREGKDVTLIAWSKMVWTCLDAAKVLAEDGIEAEVVDPRTLRPLDVETLATSVNKTGRCVIVEVGWPVAGYGAEVAFQMQKHCMDALDAPIERVTSDDVPMPYAKNLEDEVQPQVKDIVAAVRRVLYLD